MPTAKPRVLIFVVAYEAESTLARVLERIPPSITDFDVEVLVIDDSSRDRTFEVGLRSAGSHPYHVKVLVNSVNQGYGGNQKLGYAYAQQYQFDYVVLLHGDGQYAPECIPELLQPLLDGAADAVFGSRMMLKGAARRGGMPLYKRLGNRILTSLQNSLLGARLSEFHSGYRAYRVSMLSKIPFERNANVFHFDTEIIIQLLLAGARIAEVPIPTYYGDEICRVDGIRYAKDVLAATLGSRLHRLGILYDPKYDVEVQNRHYRLKLDYSSSHTAALETVAAGSRVLDIGCGPGAIARELTRKNCVVDGADQFAPEELAPFRRFVLWKEPDALPVDLREYDYVLLLDIIEHLRDPEAFLGQLREKARRLDGGPKFIVTTGNVVFVVVRLQSLIGNFNYGKRGILDHTHTRLFTFSSIRRLFEQCGYRVEQVEGIPAPFPLAFGTNWASLALVRLNSALIRLSRGLFSYQAFLIASPMPTVESLLEDSMVRSAKKAAALLEGFDPGRSRAKNLDVA